VVCVSDSAEEMTFLKEIATLDLLIELEEK
jgi:hypothetical protein